MKIVCFIFLFVNSFLLSAQTDATNVLPKPLKKIVSPKHFLKDTLQSKPVDSILDSLQSKKILNDIFIKRNDSIVTAQKNKNVYNLLLKYPLLNNNFPKPMLVSYRDVKTKDLLFYVLLSFVFVIALVRIIFPRYFNNVFEIFLQTSVRQKQTREQLSQDNIAGLLLNVLFIATSSAFVALISVQLNISKISFWQVYFFAATGLIAIYIFKLFFTQFMGWVFNKPDIALSYTFIVFIINKIIGVVLVPFLFLITFSSKNLAFVTLKVSLFIIAFLFLFRFFSTYKNLGNRLKINAIHFFLYFCSIEILPLLIMYKLINNYIGN